MIEVWDQVQLGKKPQGHQIKEVPLSKFFFCRFYHRRLSIKGEPKIPLGRKYRMSNKIAKATAILITRRDEGDA